MFPLLAAFSLVGSVLGTGLQVAGAMSAASAQKKAEQLREKQMMLEAKRQRREAIRASLRARAQALTTATTQGAQSGSALAGANAGISQQTTSNLQGINYGQVIGQGVYKANQQYYNAQSLVSFGEGLSSISGTIGNNADTIQKIIG